MLFCFILISFFNTFVCFVHPRGQIVYYELDITDKPKIKCSPCVREVYILIEPRRKEVGTYLKDETTDVQITCNTATEKWKNKDFNQKLPVVLSLLSPGLLFVSVCVCVWSLVPELQDPGSTNCSDGPAGHLSPEDADLLGPPLMPPGLPW